ncbi:MAG TPA: LLM class flavin-dependent oxidoreductase [Solirubrobacteraceae bacterium]|jgi:alkanesulfonate monooxygenase SsuD/methylene tetrahydromethanopterin reductase-like flavin-dependent oxidoreductase (luciferase family)|nr:LLM class flavin-dependent oxidoreductase [Solirubrobacteraceae bacterium]
MNFGMLLLFAHAGSSLTEAELFQEECDVGVFAEEVGLDSVWAPEHHFDKPYCMSPDNLDVLMYIACKTERIKLGTGGVILPWHKDPMRVAERLNILDIISKGRVLLGFGRGLARIEYDTFGVKMDDSRGRFDEAAAIVMQGLDNGVVEEFHGKYFDQPRAPIFPKSERTWRDRIHTIAMSPPSTISAAEFGGTLMCFNYQYPLEQQAEQFETWRTRYREVHQSEPPAPVLLDFCYCHEDPEHADAHMRAYLGKFYNAMVDHYEFDGQHFGNTHEYSSYQDGADMLREVGREAAFDFFYSLQLKGSPEQIIETIKQRREAIGEYQQMVLMSFGGMDFSEVRASLKLLGDKVIPEFKAPALTTAG